jgi:hypothetical protein
MIDAALFQSGRPIIIVPYIQKDDLNLDHMVGCWDGGQAAARAFMFTNAETVDLLIAQNEKTKNDDREIRGVDMAAHLARPDVKVEIEIIPAADFDVADTVLSYAAENSATHRDGRLWPRQAARAHSRRSDPRYTKIDDRSGVDVALRASRPEARTLGFGFCAFAVATAFLGATSYIGPVERPAL